MFSSNRIISKEEAEKLDLSTRISLEAKITDRRSQAMDFEQFKQMDTDLAHFAQTMPGRKYLFDFLGDMEGKLVLDLACGYAMTPVIFAMAGATVVAVDVAPRTLATVKAFAEYKGVGDRVHVIVTPGEFLPFATESFDLIHGNAALHHLQLDRAAPQIARVLQTGGRAAFQDPLGENPVIEFIRDHVAYAGKHPEKGTDHPLFLSDVKSFGSRFKTFHFRSYQFLDVVGRVLKINKYSPTRAYLQRCDEILFRRVPYLQKLARYVVVCVEK
jgi:SAM-dependent methyltransferase